MRALTGAIARADSTGSHNFPQSAPGKAVAFRSSSFDRTRGPQPCPGRACRPGRRKHSTRRIWRPGTTMIAAERQRRIVQHVTRNGSAKVMELAAMLSVTQETIRRDLEKLEADNKL